MRERRFRIWDNEFRAYRKGPNKVHHLSQKDGVVMSIALNPDIKKLSGESRFKMEDSTGCFDIHGVEIFEGDLVCLEYQGCHPHEDLHNIMEIIYDRGAFKLKPRTLSPPTFRGVGGGNMFFSHIVEIVGHDKDGDPIYNFAMPPARPLCDLLNITRVIGNINTTQYTWAKNE